MDVISVRRWLADGLLAAVLLVFGLVTTRFAAQNQPGATPLDTVSDVLIAVAAAALAVRRRWPVVTLAVVTAATTAYLNGDYAYGSIMFCFLVAVYTVAAELPLRPAAVFAGAALVAVSVHAFVPFDGDPGIAGLAPAAAWVVVPFAVGATVRLSREATARARLDAARRIADDERLRVAQEVHDVVGHGLAAINMQAEIALHLLHRKPEQTEAALTAISRTSKQGLDELRATLVAVRRGYDRTPMPGLGQLPALRERLADAGLPVFLTIDGTPPEVLPGVVDLAAYRIVQEALTNVLRHAGAANAEVTIRYGTETVELEVTDTGIGGAPSHHGTGIAGMRERATALGGELTAGPLPGRGFRVHAVLPVAGS
ncbi:sensor histidine kinase [Paractinoplanes globisporus]|uniref:histidine kinase n=1 Tax=Paractinoplanes globisporus TaxID=113565 RepID=A0ABW6WBP6_9ACTN|nr:sensor histidine kinase [Actinoplanes globisporus]